MNQVSLFIFELLVPSLQIFVKSMNGRVNDKCPVNLSVCFIQCITNLNCLGPYPSCILTGLMEKDIKIGGVMKFRFWLAEVLESRPLRPFWKVWREFRQVYILFEFLSLRFFKISTFLDVAANSNPRNCKKIYFLWVTRTQKQFEWLVDIIR